MTHLRGSLYCLLVSTLIACGGGGGGGGLSEPTSTVVFRKGAVSGDSQSATVATTLAVPLTVVILVDGAPAAGRVVHFTPAAGAGTVLPATDTTGADGIATTQWTLGTASGVRTLNATAEGVSGPAISFRATAVPGAPATLALSLGQGQVQETGKQFSTALVVRVADGFGNGVPGVNVGWQVTSGTGSVGAPSSVTTAAGLTAVSVTAGDSVGPLQVQASVDSLAGSPVSFDLSVTAPTSVITVGSNFFSPAADTISAGGLVRWVWSSGTHNVSFVSGPESFPNSGDKSAPDSYGPLVLSTPGTYSYECTIHSGMTGTITVQ